MAKILPALDEALGILKMAMSDETAVPAMLRLELPERTLLRRAYQVRPAGNGKR